MGKVIVIGIKAQRKYLYSITRKYRKMVKNPEKILISLYIDRLNKIEINVDIEAEAPIATIKNGIALLMCIFIL